MDWARLLDSMYQPLPYKKRKGISMLSAPCTRWCHSGLSTYVNQVIQIKMTTEEILTCRWTSTGRRSCTSTAQWDLYCSDAPPVCRASYYRPWRYCSPSGTCWCIRLDHLQAVARHNSASPPWLVTGSGHQMDMVHYHTTLFKYVCLCYMYHWLFTSRKTTIDCGKRCSQMEVVGCVQYFDHLLCSSGMGVSHLVH